MAAIQFINIIKDLKAGSGRNEWCAWLNTYARYWISC